MQEHPEAESVVLDKKDSGITPAPDAKAKS